MRTQGYSETHNDLAEFLRDEIAGQKVGQTAVAFRAQTRKANEEEAKTRRAQEVANAEKKRAAEEQERAKKYPLVARLTCGMGGADNRHLNIYACFSDKANGTELRLRNGASALAIYKMHNLMQVGREARDGYYVDLEQGFSLLAQNASDHFILRLEILDRLSRKVLYDNSAARHEVVRAAN